MSVCKLAVISFVVANFEFSLFVYTDFMDVYINGVRGMSEIVVVLIPIVFDVLNTGTGVIVTIFDV